MSDKNRRAVATAATAVIDEEDIPRNRAFGAAVTKNEPLVRVTDEVTDDDPGDPEDENLSPDAA
jgi:hypothetical protein